MAEPKDVAGRPASLPAQQAAADPLQSYCIDGTNAELAAMPVAVKPRSREAVRRRRRA